jgi:AAA15 family ATPase/GTPase
MKIRQLSINEFRHMKNVKIEFGDNLTLITGLNGTGKSSILGLTGHLFSFREGTPKFKYKTLEDKPFETKYSEIFHFCSKHDIGKEYEYSASLVDDDNKEFIKNAKSRFIKSEERFRLDVGERKEEEGKISHPVIFLGLRRLFPLAQEKDEDILIDEGKLTNAETAFFINESDEIFVSLDKNISPEHVKTTHKNFFAIQTARYGGIGNSAGQDNVGQILTALLSLKQINKGGILLIDEIDTTLFAGAQINLIKRLYKYSKQNKLQIIFTTHSLDLIDFVNRQNWDGVKTNFLEMKNGSVMNTVDPDYYYIESRILRETKEKDFVNMIDILCEDEVAAAWCKNLINGSELKNMVEVNATNLSNGGLVSIAKSKAFCFGNFIYALDGDCVDDKTISKLKNVIFLPGKKCPETEMYNFLKNLPEDDHFWGGDNFFFKDTCFNGHVTQTTASGHKQWFSDKRNNFGKGFSKLFNTWKRKNTKSVEKFSNSLEKAYKHVTE